jgi:tetratricopeptide (TPR) repeat protein
MTNEARQQEVEDLVASYVDRMNRGERLTSEQIRQAHPQIADEILDHLETFVDLSSRSDANEPLGTLGDYTLRRQIGRGGMGVVYEAWENSMDRRVALKVLPAGIAADERAVARFVREAQLAGRLNHPNVVSVYGMGVKEQTPYYAMEYVEGETMAHVLATLKDAEPDSDTPFGKKDHVGYFAALASAFADVADGLQHAHAKKVIHRDIKPSNLILDGEGRLRILDFGLARLEGQESLTLSGDFLGTPQYMSPEQARRKKIEVDHRTDVYSLGATMYEALCERPPFHGKDHNDTLSQIIERDPAEPRKVNPRVPNDLATIVLKCLRKEAADRYGTAEALGQDLRRFVRGDPIEARPQSAWERLAQRALRMKRMVAVGGAILLLAIVVTWLAARTLREAGLRAEEAYEPRVRHAVELLQQSSLNRRTDAWEPLIIDRTGEVFRSGFPQDAFGSEEYGPLETAMAELEGAARSLPRRPDAPYYLARAFLLREDTDSALGALDRATAADPGFVPALILRASILERRGDKEAANAIRDEAERAAHGTWAEVWLAARRLEKRKGWQAASAAFDTLVQLASAGREPYVGASVEARVGRAVARLEGQDVGGALKDLGVARFLWPGAVEPALLEAKAHYLLGEKEKAAGLLNGLLLGARLQDDVAVGAMAVYISLRDYDEVLAWAEMLSPGYLREMMLAEAYVLLGRLEEAERAVTAALALRVGDLHASTFLAVVLYGQMKRHEEALKLLDLCLEQNPRDSWLHYHRGRLFWAWGKPDLAVASYRRCLDCNPGWAIPCADLGLCLIDQGNPAEGLEMLHQACRMAPEDLGVWNNLGWGLSRMSRLTEALEAFGEAIRLDPGHCWPYSNRGQALERLGRLDEALADHRKALHLLPLSQAGYAGAGRILERQGRAGEALTAYVDALEVEPWDSTTHVQVSTLLRRASPEVSGSQVDRLAICLEKAFAKGTKEPRALETLALASALAPSRRDLDLALSHVLRGGEGVGKAPEVLADLVASLWLVLCRLQTTRSAAEHPLAMLTDLPDYLLIDGVFDLEAKHQPESERTLIEKLQATLPSGAALHRLLYLEGRFLQRAGSHREAAAAFARLVDEDASSPEPHLRLAECLRAEGEPAAAAGALEKVCAAGSLDDRRVWDLWLAILLADLKRVPGEVLRLIPEEAKGHAGDLRWLLERLDAHEVIRIDCGGKGFESRTAAAWVPDRFFTGGSEGGCLSIEIDGTEEDALYQTERWFPGTGSLAAYRLPVPPGRSRVTLHFAETWFCAPGMRRFDVLIEGEPLLPDHEPFAAGPRRANCVTREVYVADGILDITFVHKVDNPTVAGIEVERLDD